MQAPTGECERLQAQLMETTAQLARASEETAQHREENEILRRQLAEAQMELDVSKRKQEWLRSELASERHSRQVLEASLSVDHSDMVARIRDIVRSSIPRDATVLVVSKGDVELLSLDGRQGWHFPRGEDGGYAGYYPADSAAAIEHLQTLIAQGGQFLLFPNAAFWWLEHYRGLQQRLDHLHIRIWRDDRCAIYRLSQAGVQENASLHPPNSPSQRLPVDPLARDGNADQARAGSPTAGRPEVKPVATLQPRTTPQSRLDGRMARAKRTDRYDVICFPIINWSFRFQRPQQLMSQFAAAGHRVFYLSQEFRASGEPYVLRELAANIYEVSIRGPRMSVYQNVLDDGSRDSFVGSLDALRRGCSLGATAAIVQLPFWWPVANQTAASFAWPIIYDCMDHHAGFSTNHPLMLEQEREMLSRADLVVASSASLESEARKYNANVVLVRNACDYDHFAKVGNKPKGSRPVIGYFGAIADWFDSDLVADLAKRRPDWDFILVGSTFTADIGRLSKLRNVSLPGEKPYAEIPDWLARFNVTILPFKRTPLTEATNPVKAYEIFASGRPLVSVPLPELRVLAPLVRLASTAVEFEREIEKELTRSDAALNTRRRAFARENTWQKRFELLSPAVENLFIRRQQKRPRGTTNPLPGRSRLPARRIKADLM